MALSFNTLGNGNKQGYGGAAADTDDEDGDEGDESELSIIDLFIYGALWAKQSSSITSNCRGGN